MSSAKALGIFSVVGIGVLLGITRGCNEFYNRDNIKTNSSYVRSYPIGISGHVEYYKYPNGSQEVIEYPGQGTRYFDTDTYKDLDGNNTIDVIVRNNGEIKLNSISEVLFRDTHYNSDKKRFDDADKFLKEVKDKVYK